MVVLGVDPSFTATGYAVLQQQGNKQQLLYYGHVSLNVSKDLSERVGIFYDFFNKLIPEYAVTHIALETPFLGKNVQTFLKLGYLRGILHLLARQHGIAVVEFAPSEIKQTITGFGSAQKDQVARMVHMLFPRLPLQKSLDVTDAIAISLCGLWRRQASHSFLS